MSFSTADTTATIGGPGYGEYTIPGGNATGTTVVFINLSNPEIVPDVDKPTATFRIFSDSISDPNPTANLGIMVTLIGCDASGIIPGGGAGGDGTHFRALVSSSSPDPGLITLPDGLTGTTLRIYFPFVGAIFDITAEWGTSDDTQHESFGDDHLPPEGYDDPLFEPERAKGVNNPAVDGPTARLSWHVFDHTEDGFYFQTVQDADGNYTGASTNVLSAGSESVSVSLVDLIAMFGGREFLPSDWDLWRIKSFQNRTDTHPPRESVWVPILLNPVTVVVGAAYGHADVESNSYPRANAYGIATVVGELAALDNAISNQADMPTIVLTAIPPVVNGPLPSRVTLIAVITPGTKYTITDRTWAFYTGPGPTPTIHGLNDTTAVIEFSAYVPGDYTFTLTLHGVFLGSAHVAPDVQQRITITLPAAIAPTVENGQLNLTIGA